VEVAGLLRRAAAEGGFATILHKGDDQRGSLLLFVTSRGVHYACLERMPDLAGADRWQRVGLAESAGSNEVRDFLARRTRFDPDLWAIELDIAEPERFIAETTSAG
jgi:hypothetical protein